MNQDASSGLRRLRPLITLAHCTLRADVIEFFMDPAETEGGAVTDVFKEILGLLVAALLPAVPMAVTTFFMADVFLEDDDAAVPLAKSKDRAAALPLPPNFSVKRGFFDLGSESPEVGAADGGGCLP